MSEWSKSITFNVEYELQVEQDVLDEWKADGWDASQVANEIVTLLNSPAVNITNAISNGSSFEVESEWGFEPEPLDIG